MTGPEAEGDLGFRYAVRKGGAVAITRAGRPAGMLRGKQAERFLARAEGADLAAVQQLLARLTGNYKRGNERPNASV